MVGFIPIVEAADVVDDIDGDGGTLGLVASARPNTEATVNKTPNTVDHASTTLTALARTRHTTHAAGTDDRQPRKSHHHMDGPTAAAPRTTSEQRRGRGC
ncbi:hypothetical protein MRX96_009260 [Rhipicephalus microplus]